MNKFPKAMQILSELQGLQSAIVFNFATHEVLDCIQINPNINLNQAEVIASCSLSVMRHQKLIEELEIFDLVEDSLITTDQYYHIISRLPQFDTVAIYLIVTRYTMLSYIQKSLENAIYSMH